MQLEDITPGVRLSGVIPGEVVQVVAAQWHGSSALELTYKTAAGQLSQQVLFRSHEDSLSLSTSGSRPFDAQASDYKLAAEIQRIRLGGLFDPMLAVATSDVQPLPHQIRAVYEELLPRTPLRFLLADDPGAGKTIMAGLYIKELLLRDDVNRCLIVAPGGLVEQWQDELFYKFGLRFELLTTQLIDATLGGSAFDGKPLLIARMDQLARNETLLTQLDETEWDLVIVDEAHRMGAHYWQNEPSKTKRFLLGERLREVTRHFLLMTATPHSGKDEDFHLFLSLLDPDRFAGKYRGGTSSSDTKGVMRRMIKEDLKTFDGKPLFPERIAETVPYVLTGPEQDLYDQVTDYVSNGMNRAEKLDGKRKNTVGFAMTVLQRRLASSPEAILQSLIRRTKRLENRKVEVLAGRDRLDADLGKGSWDFDDDEEFSSEEREDVEEELMDAATAARTVEELQAEIVELGYLISAAQAVRDSGTDRKWTELSQILQDEALTLDSQGRPRKLIVFTEHRDTLDYLVRRITTLIGRPQAVQAIHGGVRRHDRRSITEEFTKNPQSQILIATDAAGEGLNLQAAHLMVNYDLPWNPNRIEQRFGRVHRIGQTETCRLWNLVATSTREGQVFVRLLEKVAAQREAYGGKVFDVLGECFEETPLRTLLKEAIQYGDLPEVRARMHQVIDAAVSEGLPELLKERAMAHETLSEIELAELRQRMDDARARRLQPHYIEAAFREAFARAGGRMAKREKGRYEISQVPAAIRASSRGPVASKYSRVTFDLDQVKPDDTAEVADLLAPGHPLHDAVADHIAVLTQGVLDRGTVLVSATVTEPTLLVGVVEEIVDGTRETVSKRFGYAFVDQSGTVSPAGPAPYLDCVAAPDVGVVKQALQAPWLADAENRAISWMIGHSLPEFLAEVEPRRAAELARARQQIEHRLTSEANRLAGDALVAQEKERRGEKVRESSDSLTRKSADLEVRLHQRLAHLAKQQEMSLQPPRLVTAALVLPLDLVESELPPEAPMHAVSTKEVERRGVDLVLSTEKALGRVPEEQAHNNPGFDVRSTLADGSTIRLEVKARIAGATDFFVTHTEVLTGKNAAPAYRLALVTVDPRGPEHDQVIYLDDPFAKVELDGFDATGLKGDWRKMWAHGRAPF